MTTTPAKCPSCDGMKYSRSASGKCSTCRGTGNATVPCLACNGHGWSRSLGQCGSCNGWGRLDVVLDAHTIDVLRERAAVADAQRAAARAIADAEIAARVEHETKTRRAGASSPGGVDRDIKPENPAPDAPQRVRRTSTPLPIPPRKADPPPAEVVESTVVYDDDARADIERAWRAAEGPQRGVKPGRRAA